MFLRRRAVFFFGVLAFSYYFFLSGRPSTKHGQGFSDQPGMRIDAAKYRTVSYWQMRDGATLQQMIPRSLAESASIVIDIGCGPGDMTELLVNAFPQHERLILLDVDPTMTQHAKDQNRGKKTLEFIVQDFGVPFKELDPSLQALEGRVDVIWSNYVLHYMKPIIRPRTVLSVWRLLKPGGMAFINIPMIEHILDFCSPSSKRELQKYTEFPDLEEDANSWRQAFILTGFQVKMNRSLDRQWTFDRNALKPFEGFISSVIQVYLQEEYEGNEQILSLVDSCLQESESAGSSTGTFQYDLLTIVATKREKKRSSPDPSQIKGQLKNKTRGDSYYN